jgi:hypothetical protein
MMPIWGSATQHDPTPLRQRLRRLRPPRPPLQRVALLIGQHHSRHPLPHALHPYLLLLAHQVERWFGLLTDKKLRRGAHRSIQALEKDIRDWIANWNDNPKPFTWTKSADAILERLNSYLQRIPGAGH